MTMIRKFIGDNKAATAIEYGLIAALIAVAGITAFRAVGTSVVTTFNNAANQMK
ncbi:MAG: Flp family type IVb pilin [Sphingopyxis sp.]|jgi:pilus assembly protein Flp/PilA|nr:Flp family type IVb pilin [Sphingopyxis sp.]